MIDVWEEKAESSRILKINQSVSRQFAAAGSYHQLAELGLAHQLVKLQYYIKEEPPTLNGSYETDIDTTFSLYIVQP